MSSFITELQALMDSSIGHSSTFTKTIMPKMMKAEEAIDFINEQKSGVLATVRKDGSPHTAWNPVAYVSGKLYTYADPHSVFYRNLKRDGRVSIAITSGIKALLIEGRAREVGQVKELIETLLAVILAVAKDWIPRSSYNYSSLEDCEAYIFEIDMSKILSYNG